VVILVPFNVKKRDWVLLADVLVQNHQDIRSVEDLAYYLASLFCVELFKNVQYFSNDLADSEDGFHVLLGFEILHIVIEDFTNDLVTDHGAHFVPAHFLGDIDELFGGLGGKLSPSVMIRIQLTALTGTRINVHSS